MESIPYNTGNNFTYKFNFCFNTKVILYDGFQQEYFFRSHYWKFDWKCFRGKSNNKLYFWRRAFNSRDQPLGCYRFFSCVGYRGINTTTGRIGNIRKKICSSKKHYRVYFSYYNGHNHNTNLGNILI